MAVPEVVLVVAVDLAVVEEAVPEVVRVTEEVSAPEEV